MRRSPEMHSWSGWDLDFRPIIGVEIINFLPRFYDYFYHWRRAVCPLGERRGHLGSAGDIASILHPHPVLCFAPQCGGSPYPSQITTAGQFFKFDTNLAEEWEERGEEGDFFESQREKPSNKFGGRPARTSVCANAASDRIAERNVCPSALPNLKCFP